MAVNFHKLSAKVPVLFVQLAFSHKKSVSADDMCRIATFTSLICKSFLENVAGKSLKNGQSFAGLF
jgi:hypothetical protein